MLTLKKCTMILKMINEAPCFRCFEAWRFAQFDLGSGRLNISVLNTDYCTENCYQAIFWSISLLVIRSTYLQLFCHCPSFYWTFDLKGKRNSIFLTSSMTVENVYWTDESGRLHSTQSFTFHSGCTGCRQNKSGE